MHAQKIKFFIGISLFLAFHLSLAPSLRAADNKNTPPAPIEDYQWEFFTVKERDTIYYPDKIIRSLRLKKGDVVAELEPGSGYWTFRLADAVGPTGKVYAVDAYPLFEWRLWKEFYEKIENKTTNPNQNVRHLRVPVDFIGLPKESVDIAFICQTGILLYNSNNLKSSDPIVEANRRRYVKPQFPLIKSLYDSLKPGGQAVVIDMLKTPLTEQLPALPGREIFEPIMVAQNTQDVITNYESLGFRLKSQSYIYNDSKHRKNIQKFKLLPIYREMSDDTKALFASEMFFLIFEKPKTN